MIERIIKKVNSEGKRGDLAYWLAKSPKGKYWDGRNTKETI
jgi:hypothetical protein